MFVDGHELGSGPDIQWLWPRSPGVGDELWAAGAGAPDARLDVRRQRALRLVVGDLAHAPDRQLGDADQQHGGPEEHPRPARGDAAAVRRRASQRAVRQRRQPAAARVHAPVVVPAAPRLPRPEPAGIKSAIAAAEDRHSANDGPIYLDGARDVPVPPPSQEPTTKILDPAPCGYLLTAEQYAARVGSAPGDEVQWTSTTAKDRLDAHGVEVDKVGAGMVRVPLGQPLRALIPYMLDPGPRVPGAGRGAAEHQHGRGRAARRPRADRDRRLDLTRACRTASTTRAAASTT